MSKLPSVVVAALIAGVPVAKADDRPCGPNGLAPKVVTLDAYDLGMSEPPAVGSTFTLTRSKLTLGPITLSSGDKTQYQVLNVEGKGRGARVSYSRVCKRPETPEVSAPENLTPAN